MSIQQLGTLLQTLHASRLSDLVSYQYSQPGQTAWVDTLKCEFIAAPSNTTIADGYTVLDGYNVQWQRVLGSSAKKWLTQNTWYIDGYAGNDENDGYTSITPLKTADEIQRRWGSDPFITNPVTINYLSNLDHMFLHWTRSGTTSCVSLIGTTTILQSNCHLTTWTPQNTSTPEETLITSADVSDWTPYIGNRINFGGTTGWMRVLAIPSGSAINVARVNKFAMYHDGNPQHVNTLNTPTVGSTFSIENINTIGSLGINVYDSEPMLGMGTNSYSPAFYARTISTTNSTTIHTSSGNGNWNANFYDCDLADLVCNTIQVVQGGLLKQNYTTFGASVNAGFCAVTLGNNNGDKAVVFRGISSHFSGVIFQGIAVSIVDNSVIQMFNCGFYDIITNGNNAALFIGDTVSLNMQIGNLIGANNAGYGLAIAQNGKLIHSNSTVLNLKGIVGDIKLTDGLANIISTFTWANSSLRKFDKGSGTATLSSGTIAVSVESLPSDAIIVAIHKTISGSPGLLYVSAQSTSGFTITSTSGTDNSVINWMWNSPSAGIGGIVNS